MLPYNGGYFNSALQINVRCAYNFVFSSHMIMLQSADQLQRTTALETSVRTYFLDKMVLNP
jgi:hypothetical protein